MSRREPTPAAAVPGPEPRPGAGAGAEMPVSVAVAGGEAGTVTARRAGGLRDLALDVDPKKVGLEAALQHLAKAVNIAFQTDYGENYLESVYQAAIVRRGAVIIVHREYFGFGDTWFSQFGRLIRSLELTMEGPDPASPEGQAAYEAKGARSIRGLLNLLGRKLDLVSEYEDRVPAYVEQMFDRLEASGILVGWDRDNWEITTTTIGLDIRIERKAEAPPAGEEAEAVSPAIPPPKR
ncbi:hypothetical protein OJF2_16350 [Aquisphaera giovannonii]|uniref:Uncharacterized protein n=1 Tax=Aquisphaera giovannonii TaxID=406548 RepID=A0A5B9VXW0_9BACT|nr:hypothetical protein [Aquisphaera giovannonii]QEH33138.1 hypothetical protein OJF2_16350 [Aquisphaera giovannonii]